ncbi:unnamed protein product [Schistosoma margrebowiei]|uniref:Uncharacterized protein n=1 Tax=Schistosoma margrebowiei TaxID=48269 RepID=A0A183MLD1_9TREM|nr:unnamed protein product [Schistosoma margrebowiei]
MKKRIRDDKQKYVEKLATMEGKAACDGNMKQLYDATKKLAGKSSKPERPVKDKESSPITEIQKQRNRWVEYFEELLNRPTPLNSHTHTFLLMSPINERRNQDGHRTNQEQESSRT